MLVQVENSNAAQSGKYWKSIVVAILLLLVLGIVLGSHLSTIEAERLAAEGIRLEEARLATIEAERIAAEEAAAAEAERIRLEDYEAKYGHLTGIEKEINYFLLTEPEGAGAARLQTWRLLKPTNLALFESFYRRVSGEIQYRSASFGEYNDSNSQRTYDTAMTRGGELNGPRRFIWSDNGDIHTRTCKDGEWHGLNIVVKSDEIEVYVYREGNYIFELRFTTSGREIYHWDYENSFTDVTPEMFLIEVEVVEYDDECVDGLGSDIGGDGCGWYTDRIEKCGDYDTGNFKAEKQCCVCK